MNDFTGKLLNRVDQATRRMGPLSVGLSNIVERLLPQSTALAGCGGYQSYCYSTCEFTGRCPYNHEWIAVWAPCSYCCGDPNQRVVCTPLPPTPSCC
jgi:hypothetical protein